MNSTKAARIRGRKPYLKTNSQRGVKVTSKNMDTNVLVLKADSDSDLLCSDSDLSQKSAAPSISTTVTPIPNVQMAKNEMMSLLKEIRDSQSSQCTKNDLQEYSLTITKKFSEVDRRVTSNTSSINSMSSRLSRIESSMESNKHDSELTKQNVLARNLSIMGIPLADNEDLTLIALKVFTLVGCELSRADIFGCYRVKKGNSFTDIVIVKLNDFAVKHQIMKSKVNKQLRLQDVINSNTMDANQIVYINNHVTPFFGKLLAEGRRAVKDKKIHSVWLNKEGCRLRFDVDGDERSFRSTKEFNALISAHMNRPAKQNKRIRPDDDHISPNSSQKPKK